MADKDTASAPSSSSSSSSISSASSATIAIIITTPGHDVESQRRAPPTATHWTILLDHGAITQQVLDQKYAGQGTIGSPYLVEFLPGDPCNPMSLPPWYKWAVTLVQAAATLAVSFTSSSYTASVAALAREFHVSDEAVVLGVSMYVLGFAIGPLIWAPLSELYGRQKLFFISYMALAFFNAGCAAAPNLPSLVVLRFLAGAFGSSPLTNAGGVISDMFPASERGIASSIYSMAPYLGPALGPIVGGFFGQAEGWRWLEGLSAIFSGIIWITCSLMYRETYTPVLLRKRAQALTRRTGKVYVSKLEDGKPAQTVTGQLAVSLSRPWLLLFREPIVFLTSLYMAILYGTLYMCFSAFPIVFQDGRGWSPGIGGLAFVGIAVGMTVSTVGSIFDNRRYGRVAAASPGGMAPPEARLPPAILGSVFIPVGLFWFAWTNGPSVHWAAPIVGSAVFASGIVLVFLSLMNYIMDSYVIFSASALAANTVLRSLFGAIFPLFGAYMYKNLGIHWASTVPAFLALACLPFPLLFYKYGGQLRLKCKYAAEAARALEKISIQNVQVTEDEASVEAQQHEKGRW